MLLAARSETARPAASATPPHQPHPAWRRREERGRDDRKWRRNQLKRLDSDSRMAPGRSNRRWLQRAGDRPGGARVMAREAPEEIVDFGLRGGAQAHGRLALRVGGDDPAPHHHIFPDGEAHALLLLVADKRQMGVEKIVSLIAFSLAGQAHDV